MTTPDEEYRQQALELLNQPTQGVDLGAPPMPPPEVPMGLGAPIAASPSAAPSNFWGGHEPHGFWDTLTARPGNRANDIPRAADAALRLREAPTEDYGGAVGAKLRALQSAPQNPQNLTNFSNMPRPMPAAGPAPAGPVDPSTLVFAGGRPGEAPQGDQPLTLHGFGGRTVGAHNVGLISPELEQGWNNAFAQQKGAYLGKEETQRELGGALAEAGKHKAGAIGEEKQAIGGIEQRAEEKSQRWTDDLRATFNDIQKGRAKLAEEGQTNPRKEESFLDAARWKLAEVFAGFAQGFQHQGGENPIAAQHNHLIAEEIQRQKDNLQAHRQSLEDLEKMYGFASQMVQSQRQDLNQQAELGLQQAKLAPEQAAAENEGAIGQAQQGVNAAGTGVERAGLDERQVQGNIAHNKWTQAATTGGVDRKAVAALAEKYDMEAAKAGRTVSPEESTLRAMRLLYPGQVTGGPKLPDISTPAKGGAPVGQEINRLAPGALGSSTNWDPGRYFQGTNARANVLRQQDWNSSIIAAVHKSTGVKGLEAMQEIGAPYLINPGDAPKTIAQKVAAAKAKFGSAVSVPEEPNVIEPVE